MKKALQVLFFLVLALIVCAPLVIDKIEPATSAVERQLRAAQRDLSKGHLKKVRTRISDIERRYPRDWEVQLKIMGFWAADSRFEDAISVGMDLIRNHNRVDQPRRMSEQELADLYLSVSQAVYLSKGARDPRQEQLLKEGLKIDPDSPDLLNGLAWHYAETGTNLSEALLLARKAVLISPRDGNIVDTVGWIYFKKRDYRQAIVWLEKAVRLMPGQAELRLHLAEARFALRHIPQARVELAKALVLDPQLHEARTLERKMKKQPPVSPQLSKPSV